MNQPTLLLSFAANDLEGVKAEADNIWEAVQNPTIKTRRIDDATIETMTESIIDAGQDLFMFHFGGHADPNGIVLNGFQNIDKIRFSRLLMPNDQASLQVVFLNGCLSYGHVGVLTAKGVKAIIATNVDVKDKEAVTLYETHHRLEKELSTAYPTNVEYAYSFAVSYSKLGEIHCSLEDDLEKGLPFYEERFRLIQALYSEHPTNVRFKNGFAVTHSELADTYSDLDKFDKALPLYEAMNTLYQELYRDHPLMALFKTSLAMSYSRLGDVHSNLGDEKKAEEFYKEGEKVLG
jgi:tetratricopeptide (TPR) repeat protein